MSEQALREPSPSSTFFLDSEKLDEALVNWARKRGLSVASIPDALVRAPGFDLVSLTKDVLPDWHDPKLGPLSNALEAFGYWLFVNFGHPLVAHPPGFHLKTVGIIATRRAITYDDRRAVLRVSRNADPVLVPVPAVPKDLMPGATTTFERSRAALLSLARGCVDRVNLVAGAALALDALVQGGYPAGAIDY